MIPERFRGLENGSNVVRVITATDGLRTICIRSDLQFQPTPSQNVIKIAMIYTYGVVPIDMDVRKMNHFEGGSPL